MTIASMFWSRVDKNGPMMSHMPTNCWIWTGPVNKQGYGNFNFAGLKVGAHRWSFGTHKIISDNEVLHRCDNPPCVRRAHLKQGTHAENMAEMSQRKRARNWWTKWRELEQMEETA